MEKTEPIPRINGEPVISDQLEKPGFTIDARDLVVFLKNQNEDFQTGFIRELVQNSIDAMSDRIRLELSFEGDSMVFSCFDQGTGMSFEIMMESYLTAFNSTKDKDGGAPGKIGVLGLGRFQALAVSDFFSMEVVTVQKEGPGLRLSVNSDMGGTLVRLSRESAMEQVHYSHGTLVRVAMKPADEKKIREFADAALNFIKTDLCFVRPQTTYKYPVTRDGQRVYETACVNKTIENHIGAGNLPRYWEVCLKAYPEVPPCKLHVGLQDKVNKGSCSIFLMKGGLIIEKLSKIEFLSTPFALNGLQIYLDSYYFKTNISRNKVIVDDYLVSLLEAVFRHIVQSYVAALARQVISFSEKPYAFLDSPFHANLTVTRNVIADCFIKLADGNVIPVPDAVREARIFPSTENYRYYSWNDLDGALSVTYSNQRLDDLFPEYGARGADDSHVSISLIDFPSTVDRFVVDHYFMKIRKDTPYLFSECAQDVPPLVQGMIQDYYLRGLAGIFENSLNVGEGYVFRYADRVSVQRITSLSGQELPHIRCVLVNELWGGCRAVLNAGNQEMMALVQLSGSGNKDERAFGIHNIIREVLLLIASQEHQPLSLVESVLDSIMIRNIGNDGSINCPKKKQPRPSMGRRKTVGWK